MTSTALLTDRYELTMLDAALHDGTGQRPCAFEMFARELPDGRRFGVVAGTERWIDALANFRFGQAELDMLDDDHVVSADTLRWLADYRFTGDVDGYREGELYFANSPVLTVRGTFAEAVLLESLTLSVFNHDSAIASAGARMVQAAGDRGLLEFGSRRTHELAAVDAARAAVLVGFSGTSNLEAGRRYGVPTLGTSAHAFTLIHDDETAAFDAQVAALGRGTTLLIDTYDIPDGLQRAIDVAGEELGGVRIDSGDLAREARRAREQLDAAGLTETKIIASGDLDEQRIAELAEAPIDGYGVGTALVTGSGAPAAGFVYKLVARATTPDGALEPVAKAGGVKATIGGCKAARRRLVDGLATEEVLLPLGTDRDQDGRALQVPIVRQGEPVYEAGWREAREHHRSAIAELPPEGRSVTAGDPILPTVIRMPGGSPGRLDADHTIHAPTEEVAG
jgi:nicotinate phosphoribosyltransferase